MSGSLLGPDQIRKVNATFPVLVSHLRSLLAADHTGLGLMRVHCTVESFDSDEMARIFRELSFISPKEKLALVRAAIYELHAKEPALFIAPEPIIMKKSIADEVLVTLKDKPGEIKVFTPAQFNLNVNKAEDFHGKKTEDTPAPEPVVTSTHTSKSAVALEEGKKQIAAQQDKMNAAVAKLREASVPKIIGVDVAADGKETTVVAEVTPEGQVNVISETQTPAQE